MEEEAYQIKVIAPYWLPPLAYRCVTLVFCPPATCLTCVQVQQLLTLSCSFFSFIYMLTKMPHKLSCIPEFELYTKYGSLFTMMYSSNIWKMPPTHSSYQGWNQHVMGFTGDVPRVQK